jgi:hypothetical protein
VPAVFVSLTQALTVKSLLVANAGPVVASIELAPSRITSGSNVSPSFHLALPWPVTGSWPTRSLPRFEPVTAPSIWSSRNTYYVLAGTTPVWCTTPMIASTGASKSVETFGHTFSTHGAGPKITKDLTGRAAGTGQSQGQWLNNDAAAEFLKSVHVSEAGGARSVLLPKGLGQVIMPDGSIVEARAATLVPSSNGGYKSAYPILGPTG